MPRVPVASGIDKKEAIATHPHFEDLMPDTQGFRETPQNKHRVFGGYAGIELSSVNTLRGDSAR